MFQGCVESRNENEDQKNQFHYSVSAWTIIVPLNYFMDGFLEEISVQNVILGLGRMRKIKASGSGVRVILQINASGLFEKTPNFSLNQHFFFNFWE